ncbi:hypothetical protein C2845_PM04G27790 [Panicum miliaceum]|uniref:Uncharacterized protein n=1 Tax=Panicum miliaceum TaxID=4540 RepID=A0A3L6QLW5_PANMI|nr:hypothetical protein C2845_PM04G27790 [Panicum miliaceum]
MHKQSSNSIVARMVLLLLAAPQHPRHAQAQAAKPLLPSSFSHTPRQQHARHLGPATRRLAAAGTTPCHPPPHPHLTTPLQPPSPALPPCRSHLQRCRRLSATAPHDDARKLPLGHSSAIEGERWHSSAPPPIKATPSCSPSPSRARRAAPLRRSSSSSLQFSSSPFFPKNRPPFRSPPPGHPDLIPLAVSTS